MLNITIPGQVISDNCAYGHRAFGKSVARYLTAKGKAYKQAVREQLYHLKLKPTDKQVMLYIDVYFGDKRKRDVHGHLKILIDCLSGIIIDDDVQVQTLIVRKFYDKERPRVELMVMEE